MRSKTKWIQKAFHTAINVVIAVIHFFNKVLEGAGIILKAFLLFIWKSIEKNHQTSNWINITALLTNMMTLAALHSMDLISAGYEKKRGIYVFSHYANFVLTVVLIWEFLSIVGTELLEKAFHAGCARLKKSISKHRPYFLKSRWCAFTGGIFSIAVMVLFLFCVRYDYHTTKYYASITESYGMPKGFGDPLKKQERAQIAEYWKVDEYIFRNHVTFTYMDHYQQLEILQTYSTAYNYVAFSISSAY